MGLQMSKTYRQYTENLESRLGLMRTLSDKAREKGLDPALKTECRLAKDLADLVEGLVDHLALLQASGN